MIIAVDKGTTYTKTSDMFSIKSVVRKYQPTELNFSQDKIIVEYINNKYKNTWQALLDLIYLYRRIELWPFLGGGDIMWNSE